MPQSVFFDRSVQIQTKTGRATISYLVCEPLASAGFANAFSTRPGGVSSLPSDDLNLVYRDDTKDNVNENRRRFLEALGRSSAPLITARQTHSDKITMIEDKVSAMKEEPLSDALISDRPDIFVGIKTADCLPVLIGDPKTGFFAAIHAGWRGTLQRIVEKTVNKMVSEQKINASNCLAALGPAACGKCYEVGKDVADSFKQEFPGADQFLSLNPRSGKFHLDSQGANRLQLISCGLQEGRIFSAPRCTMEENDLFFSFRKEGQPVAGGQPRPMGRQLAVIGHFPE